jgi:DNA-directed RNA polymerase subunit K/omega
LVGSPKNEDVVIALREVAAAKIKILGKKPNHRISRTRKRGEA